MTPEPRRTIGFVAEGDERAVSVDVAPDAAWFLREKGGILYVWVSGAGLLEAKTVAPSHSERWGWHNVNGVRVAIGDSASQATAWTIELRHVPWKHLDITSNLTMSANTLGEYTRH